MVKFPLQAQNRTVWRPEYHHGEELRGCLCLNVHNHTRVDTIQLKQLALQHIQSLEALMYDPRKIIFKEKCLNVNSTLTLTI